MLELAWGIQESISQPAQQKFLWRELRITHAKGNLSIFEGISNSCCLSPKASVSPPQPGSRSNRFFRATFEIEEADLGKNWITFQSSNRERVGMCSSFNHFTFTDVFKKHFSVAFMQ